MKPKFIRNVLSKSQEIIFIQSPGALEKVCVCVCVCVCVGGVLIAVKHGLCSSVLVDEGNNADFFTVKLLLADNNVRLILVYGPQEDASEVEKSMFYDRVTYQIERAKLVGESVILIEDFNAKLEKDLIKNDIHDMSKNGKLLYQLYTNAELELLNSGD